MIIEFFKPHALNMGEDFEYISTFVKGKGNGKPKFENYRILLKGVKTGKEYLMMLEEMPNFFGQNRYRINLLDIDCWIGTDIVKTNKRIYTYYRYRYDINDVHLMLDTWIKSDPMVHIGNYLHQMVSKVGRNYKGTYKVKA